MIVQHRKGLVFEMSLETPVIREHLSEFRYHKAMRLFAVYCIVLIR